MVSEWYAPPSVHGVDVEERKGAGFAIEIFSKGLVLSQNSIQMGYTFSFVVLNLFGKLFQNCLSLCHTLCMTGQGDTGYL